MTHDVRVLDPDELRGAHDLFGQTIHRGPRDDDGWAHASATFSPGRTYGAHDGARLVGTATSFPTETAVPGGVVLPTAAVTRVGVRADHTRRGVLTAMMRDLLEDLAGRGEALASLRASEARIYGRFGYGVATRGRAVRVRRGPAGWRAGAPRAGEVRLLDRAEIVPVLSRLHETLALGRTGGIVRPDAWWGYTQGRLDRNEHLLAAVHSAGGIDDGFAVLAPSDDGHDFTRATRVVDLHAARPAASAELWRFALDIDLVDAVEGSLRPLDEPLELLLADPRDCTVTGVEDETWLRLVDVPAALAARSYGELSGGDLPGGDLAGGTVEPVLIAVHDPFLEQNAGVYRIGGGTAERVEPMGGPTTPDLECDVAALAMAYLGDRRPSELVATGWWTVREPAAVARADALFATATVPWCGTYF